MLRIACMFAGVLALAGVLVLGADAAEDAKAKKKKKKTDPTTLFQKLDKDNDNKVSKEEFSKFGDVAGAKKAGKSDKIFSKLDTNGDSSLSRDEFAKIGEKKKKKKNNTAN